MWFKGCFYCRIMIIAGALLVMVCVPYRVLGLLLGIGLLIAGLACFKR